MSMKKWVIGRPDMEKAKILAEECDVDPFVALIAYGRGITDAGELELMLSDEPVLCDPLELIDIKIAADYINNAIKSGVKIAVFGDYDCDGVVATALLYDYLKTRGADVIPYIPDRIDEGYGMNCTAIDRLYAQGVGLIITVDNGITCAAEIEHANGLGIKIVVTDHHLPPEVLPNAAAVVDPHRVDCPSSFKEICGAQVAFKLVCVLDDKEPEQMLYRYADILAVATIGDVMPIINENRSIVKEGIKKIKNSPSACISAILNIAGVDRNQINAGKISFGIVPRINAAGRMGSAFRAFELLTSTDMMKCLKLAGELDDENARRQQIEKQIYSEAVKIIEDNGYHHNRVIVVSGENWNAGVLGIAAARICENFGKPTLVLTTDGEIAHGSGRSFSGFHLYEALNYCADLLVKYGGHELAAGVSVDNGKIDEFRKKINDFARCRELSVPQLKVDCRINPAAMNVDMAYAIKELEPFGQGNPTPIFCICECKIEKITPIGNNKHLKLLCSKNGNYFQCLMFGTAPAQFEFCVGDIVDVAFTLDINIFQGQENISVQLKSIRKSNMDFENYFEQKKLYEDFAAGIGSDYVLLCPSREQVGDVYRFVKSAPVNIDRLLNELSEKLGYAKTRTSVDTLAELGLISIKDGIVAANIIAQKTDLLNSKTYKILSAGVIGNE